jgi:hypothetical protein
MRHLAILSLVLGSVVATGCLLPPPGGGAGPAYSGGGGAYNGGGGAYNGGGGQSSSEAMPASQPASMSSSQPAAPAGPVSVTIRSACSQTVKVFFGDKPKYGSGTYSSISSNSVQSHSFQPGDMMWIVDESENGLGSTSVSAGTRELEIGSGCTSIMAR